MSLTSTELSLSRLLERTKRLSRTDLAGNVWKIVAAITYLDNLYSTMQDERGYHSQDVLMQYGRELNQLKMLVEAEQKKTADEKLAQLDRIPHTFPDISIDTNSIIKDSISSTSSRSPILLGESSAGIRARNRAVYRADLRKQLMGDDMKRIKQDGAVNEDMSRQADLQDELASELLSMTRSLKMNMTLAGNVIKDDNKLLGTMQQQVDENRDRLGAESTRLARHAYKCGFDCMLVFVVLFIFWSFICMVVVMKIFPKRVSS